MQQAGDGQQPPSDSPVPPPSRTEFTVPMTERGPTGSAYVPLPRRGTGLVPPVPPASQPLTTAAPGAGTAAPAPPPSLPPPTRQPYPPPPIVRGGGASPGAAMRAMAAVPFGAGFAGIGGAAAVPAPQPTPTSVGTGGAHTAQAASAAVPLLPPPPPAPSSVRCLQCYVRLGQQWDAHAGGLVSVIMASEFLVTVRQGQYETMRQPLHMTDVIECSSTGVFLYVTTPNFSLSFDDVRMRDEARAMLTRAQELGVATGISAGISRPIASSACALWISRFGLEQSSVPWTLFLPELRAADDLSMWQAGFDSSLAELVCSREERGFVTLRSFGDFMQRFGPPRGCLGRALDLIQAPWFHWDISRDDAKERVKGSAPGTFLVRLSPVPPLSATDPRRLSLTYVDGVGNVTHVRVDNENGEYVLDTVLGVQRYLRISDAASAFNLVPLPFHFEIWIEAVYQTHKRRFKVPRTIKLNDLLNEIDRQFGGLVRVSECAVVAVTDPQHASTGSEHSSSGTVPLRTQAEWDDVRSQPAAAGGQSAPLQILLTRSQSKPKRGRLSDADLRELSIDKSQLKLEREIGGGAFGRVYQAKYRGFPVAVKVIQTPRSKPTTDTEDDFLREVWVLKGALVPGVVALYGAGIDRDRGEYYIVMELVKGGSLEKALRAPADAEPQGHPAFPKMPLSLRLKVAYHIAAGMSRLHSLDVVHRDLKPANVLIEWRYDEYVTKLIDFGISRMVRGDAPAARGLGVGAPGDAAAAAAPTPAPTSDSLSAEEAELAADKRYSVDYAAPEVLCGRVSSRASDVYSFGILLWEIVTCARNGPYPQLVNACQVGFHVSANGLRPDIRQITHAGLVKLMQQCWATAPDQRPSFDQIEKEVEQIISDLQKAPEEQAAIDAVMHLHISSPRSALPGGLTSPPPAPGDASAAAQR